MKKITVYSTDHCGYCERAKALLKSREIPFEEIHTSRSDTDAVMALAKRSGMRTFPQIFVGEKLIGGCTDLEALDAKGDLKATLDAM